MSPAIRPTEASRAVPIPGGLRREASALSFSLALVSLVLETAGFAIAAALGS